MSATLRYDIGMTASRELRIAYPSLFNPENEPNEFDARWASRWAGIGNPRHACLTFAIKLPRQVGQAVSLLKTLQVLMGSSDGVVAKSCTTLWQKLSAALGLPLQNTELEVEQAFLSALREHPDDLTTWCGYADWLQEQSQESMQRRGVLIVGWMGKKALKVKYGVPLLALEENHPWRREEAAREQKARTRTSKKPTMAEPTTPSPSLAERRREAARKAWRTRRAKQDR